MAAEARKKQDVTDFEDKQSLAVSLAQMENRLRQAVTDMIQPTVQRTTMAVADLDIVKGIVSAHTRGLQEVQLGQFKAMEQVATIASFKEEMGRWDRQRRTHETGIDEKIEAMNQRIESYKYSLEQKESALHHLHRSVDRLGMEVNRLVEEQETAKETLSDRIDEHSKRMAQLQSEVEVKVAGLEMRHNALSDELWGEETGLAKVGGELRKTKVAIEGLEAAVDALHEGKAEAAQLDYLRSEVGKMVHEANSTVSGLRQTVGTVVTDVREHLRTASQTISAHNAAFVSEVRLEYQEELKKAAGVREEVKQFKDLTEKGISVLAARVGEADGKAASLATEVRDELEELNRRRKRDKTSFDNELKALKKRLGDVFDNSDSVVKGIEHIYNVMTMLIESESVQCHVELQDSIDRKRIALLGVKDDETVLARSTHTEPQLPRPECRAKTAPGQSRAALKADPSKRPTGGSLAASIPPKTSDKMQDPVVRVDNRCLSCSGQAPLVLSAFKMACLQYTSSPVNFKGKHRDRDELLQERSRLVKSAQGALAEGPMSRGGPPSNDTMRSTFTRGSIGDESDRDVDGRNALIEYAALEAQMAGRQDSPGLNSSSMTNISALRLPNLGQAPQQHAVSAR